jgi:predicted dehydrogenase
MIDLARWLVGDIARVNAHLAVHVPRAGLDGAFLNAANDAASLQLEFANGAHGLIEVNAVTSHGARFMEQRVEIAGADGALDATLYFGGDAQLVGARGDGTPPANLAVPAELWGAVDPRQTLMEQFAPLLCQQPVGARLFIDDILAGRRSTPSFYDGWQAQRVVDAALRSHERGGWVEVAE